MMTRPEVVLPADMDVPTTSTTGVSKVNRGRSGIDPRIVTLAPC